MVVAEEYIVQTFQNSNIIGLGEGGHHLENAHQFFQKMFEHKKIQETIDIVILEFANAGYQDILDQYIFGKEVDFNELRNIWRESTQSAGLFGECPIYFNLLKKIRDVNYRLSQDKKIRILGGDPPIDWKTINNFEDYNKQVRDTRQTFPAGLAVNFGTTQGKKILLIYSEFHLTKVTDKTIDPAYSTITSIVNKTQPGTMKVIGTIYSKTLLSKKIFKSLPLYYIIDVLHHELENDPAAKFFESSLYKDQKELTIFQDYTLKELFDALMYVGPFNNLKRRLMPAIDFDKENLIELNRRRKIFGRKPLSNH